LAPGPICLPGVKIFNNFNPKVPALVTNVITNQCPEGDRTLDYRKQAPLGALTIIDVLSPQSPQALACGP